MLLRLTLTLNAAAVDYEAAAQMLLRLTLTLSAAATANGEVFDANEAKPMVGFTLAR